jgi:hypothetical protein
MPVIEHAAGLGYLFKIDPRVILGATLADQAILAAAGVALARLLEESRNT